MNAGRHQLVSTITDGAMTIGIAINATTRSDAPSASAEPSDVNMTAPNPDEKRRGAGVGPMRWLLPAARLMRLKNASNGCVRVATPTYSTAANAKERAADPLIS